MQASVTTSRRGLWGWASYDWAGNAFATVIQTFVFAAYFEARVAGGAADATTNWGLTVGCAGAFVALSGPLLGAIADRGGRRKPWLAACTALAVAAIAGMWFVEPTRADVPLALGLLAIATIGSEAAMIFYNAMLPSLVPRQRLGRWSGIGWSLGYAGGLGCLLLVLLGFTGDHPWFPLGSEDALNIRTAFVATACWYGLFALPLLLWTPDEPRKMAFMPAVRSGITQLRQSLRRVREIKGLLLFLVARLLYIDGLATLFAFGGIFAAGSFGLDERQVLYFGIALNVSAGIGAAGMAFVTDRLGSKRTVAVSLICLFLCTSTILIVHSVDIFWIIGVTAGLFVGPIQSASRSLMAHLAPDHLRTELFGLYAFSGKATAFLGPLLVGTLAGISGSQRVALIVVPACLLGGLLLLLRVPDPEA